MISLGAYIDSFPVPAFITTDDDVIIQLNSQFTKSIKTVESNHINQIFEYIEMYEEGAFMSAVIEKRQFLFLRQKINDNFLYIGKETAFLQELNQKVIELKRLNRELDSIINSSYDGIYITDNKGVTLKTNDAIERITGIPKEYYIGKTVDKLMKRGILKNSVTPKVLKQRRTVSVVQNNYQNKETLITGSPVMNEKGDIEKVITNIRDLSELNNLLDELNAVQKRSDEYERELKKLKGYSNQGIIIESQTMTELYEMADRIADFDATVLILGETGVGKDVLARYIYRSGKRAEKGEFIKVNCGAIPPELLESELFGYEGGAFTGATKKGKPGMFELADNGVIFLDEIGELPLKMQVKLLQVIQDGMVQRVGATKSKKVDVRIIAATNRNLREMIKEGTFREDLFYRLNVIPFTIPPLRERRDDILALLQFFLDKINNKYGLDKVLTDELKGFLYDWEWEGNVREMANLMERLVLTTSSSKISIEHLPPEYRNDEQDMQINDIIPLNQAAELAEKQVISLAVQRYKSTYQIAEALQTSQPTIVRKMKKYRIEMK
ncbi:sigma-54 interaction domain-containing protein [Thalassobacillus devorans]|uniref:sigma-54 interaction domain-containing protein n=1 Tax=Thalassobacillus devorans TaxID=279813 RepID=UPI0004B69DF4|nr:sigma 54-interacting transcriptional regulator [Thalassobacillus devorans]